MTNDIHLLVVPLREDSFAESLRDTHTVYAMRLDTDTKPSGHA